VQTLLTQAQPLMSPGLTSIVHITLSQLGALVAFMQDVGWQQVAGTQSASIVQVLFSIPTFAIAKGLFPVSISTARITTAPKINFVIVPISASC
jgi:hypothetical protein